MICYGWSVRGCPSWCLCAISSNKREALLHGLRRAPAGLPRPFCPQLAVANLCTYCKGCTAIVVLTKLVSCNKVIFWQEETVKRRWPGVRQGLFFSRIKAAVKKMAGWTKVLRFLWGSAQFLLMRFGGCSVTTPVYVTTQGLICSCITPAKILFSWERQCVCTLFSASSDMPVLSSTQKEKVSSSFQPAAATAAFLQLKTVLKEKVIC